MDINFSVDDIGLDYAMHRVDVVRYDHFSLCRDMEVCKIVNIKAVVAVNYEQIYMAVAVISYCSKANLFSVSSD